MFFTGKKGSWKSEETAAVWKDMKDSIIHEQVPWKQSCEMCIAANPVLSNKTWKCVKFKVYNIVQTTQRRKGKNSKHGNSFQEDKVALL